MSLKNIGPGIAEITPDDVSLNKKYLSKLESVYLENNQLTKTQILALKDSILISKKLSNLYLRGNNITSIPNLNFLDQLKLLDLSNNELKNVDPFCLPSSLRTLILDKSHLTISLDTLRNKLEEAGFSVKECHEDGTIFFDPNKYVTNKKQVASSARKISVDEQRQLALQKTNWEKKFDSNNVTVSKLISRADSIAVYKKNQVPNKIKTSDNLGSVSTNETLKIARSVSEKAEMLESYQKSALTSEVILPPEDLKKLRYNQDYVILGHYVHDFYKEKLDLIKKDGLRSLENLCFQGNASFKEKRKHEITKSIISHQLCNDSSLVYFRPVTKNFVFDKSDNGVFIAVKAQNASVYNSVARFHADFSGYLNSKIPIADFMDDYSPDKYKHYYKSEGEDFPYFPEVCIRTGHIEPHFFVNLKELGIEL